MIATVLSAVGFYQFANGRRMGVPSIPGWCDDCRTFVNVEQLPTPGELKDGLKQFSRLGKNLAELVLDEVKNENVSDRIREDILTDSQAQFTAYGEAMSARKSPRRCLSCGSTRVFRLPADGKWIDHPGGLPGRVRVQPIRVHVSGRFEYRWYDSEGRPIPSE